MEGGALAEPRRWCSGWSRRFLLVLVFSAFFFFYSSSLVRTGGDWSPAHWLRNQTGSLNEIYRSRRPPPSPRHRPPINNDPPSPSSGPPDGKATPPQRAASTTTRTPSEAQRLTAGEGVDRSGQTQNATLRTLTPNTNQQQENVHVATSLAVNPPTVNPAAVNPAAVDAPPPYVSRGPYVVEYPSEYHFVINEPRRCEAEKPFVALVVPVAPDNRAHRDVIRETWGGERSVLGRAVSLFFLVGLQSGEGGDVARRQAELRRESVQQRDLIQADFVDCYKNLTIKTMLMMEWLDRHCGSASYAMKIDSDMFLNVDNLVRMLLAAPRRDYLSGLVAGNAQVLRDPRSKWYLPEALYPDPQYPLYALGLGYVFSTDLPAKLVAAARQVTAVYIEDVYVGLCMRQLGIRPTLPPRWDYFHVFPLAFSRCAYSRIVATTTHPHTDRLRLWRDFKRPGPYC